MAKWILVLIAIALAIGAPERSNAGFPHDGKFKAQPSSSDTWYYYDNIHWYLKAPDKWQHLMGSYASTKVFTAAFDDKLTAAPQPFCSAGSSSNCTTPCGRAGASKTSPWTPFGVSAAVFDSKSVRFVSYYTSDRLVLTVHFAFRVTKLLDVGTKDRFFIVNEFTFAGTKGTPHFRIDDSPAISVLSCPVSA